MTYQSELYKISQLIVKHIASMKENKYRSIQMQGADFEAFYNKSIELAERGDISIGFYQLVIAIRNNEIKELIENYMKDIDFLIDLSVKLGDKLGKEGTFKYCIDNVFLNELENNHNKVQES